MIAKCIVKGSDRQTAIATMIEALREYKIEGIKTNIPMLMAVLTHEAFQQGHTTTNFVNTYMNKKEGKHMHEVVALMAGNVWKIVVQVGDVVEEGQDVVILESMKMEIPVSSQVSGVVKAIRVQEGDFVNEGDVLIEIE